MTTRTRTLLALVLVAIVASGCAWSRGRSRIYQQPATAAGDEDLRIVQDLHCWTIVWGGGRLGADCKPKDLKLATEETGFSDNFAPAVEAMGVAVGKGMAAASGTGGAGAALGALADRDGDETDVELEGDDEDELVDIEEPGFLERVLESISNEEDPP